MKKIMPLNFIITGKKKKNGDNRELEIYLNVKNKEQQIETINFLKKYLKIEVSKLADKTGGKGK